ncbi:MAG: hypothetical protein DRJ46_04050 [Thermoprotei archaeon]|nr:MAG: hypothetical protein DRJ46_04050 [Thermoprotei archaeon]
MRILVDGRPIEETEHYGKGVLIDTMIICYAYDPLSPMHRKAKAVMAAVLLGYVHGHVSYQNLAEFYSIMTGKRVKNPLTPREALRIVEALIKSRRLVKLAPANYEEALRHAAKLGLRNGDVFDAVLAYTCKGVVDYVWTENVEDFRYYRSFLAVENPLEWGWEIRD